MSKFNVGDKVRYIGKDHREMPRFYPEVGTIGTVIQEVNEINYYIQWTKGSTSKEDCWYCSNNDIELVKDEDMTNEEIWKMLESKMRKNGLTSKVNVVKTNVDNYPDNEVEIIKAYYESDVINAIALAYKVGYLRSQKGRPFKIGEKKKKGGHWEPVDPNNLPKEGTKVRYSRECKNYKNCENEIVIGDAGVVKLEGPKHDWFGIKLDNHRNLYYNWLSFDGITASCLDMWVEDDE